MQPQQPRKMKAITKKRGLSGKAHTWHAMVSLFTCGLWLPVWFCVWLYRMVVRRKQVTKYYG